MKAMLRTVLFLDAMLNLTLGVLLLASFIPGFFSPSQVPSPEPAFYGQLLGVALLGFAWLQSRAAVNGQLTVAAASITGHVNWISGAILLAWILVLRTGPVLAAVVLPLLGAVLVVIGAMLVKLAGSVRVKERMHAAAHRDRQGSSPSASSLAQSRVSPVPTTVGTPNNTVTGGVTAGIPSDPESSLSVPQDARQNPHS